MGEAWSSGCKPCATLTVMKGRRQLQELIIVLRSQRHCDRFAFNFIGWELVAERMKKIWKTREAGINESGCLFESSDIDCFRHRCPRWPLLTTLCCWCFLGFQTFLFVFSCSVACGPPDCLNNTLEFPSGSCRRMHIVALLPYTAAATVPNRMRQRMCLMSVPHSRGVWIQCSVL